MVNLDGLASAYPAQREVWSSHGGLLSLAVQTGVELGWHADHVHHRRSTFSDHAPFGDAGVPSVLCWRPDYPYYHSRGDVRELVDEAAVAETASVSATMAARLAQGASLPAGTLGRTRAGAGGGEPPSGRVSFFGMLGRQLAEDMRPSAAGDAASDCQRRAAPSARSTSPTCAPWPAGACPPAYSTTSTGPPGTR